MIYCLGVEDHRAHLRDATGGIWRHDDVGGVIFSNRLMYLDVNDFFEDAFLSRRKLVIRICRAHCKVSLKFFQITCDDIHFPDQAPNTA